VALQIANQGPPPEEVVKQLETSIAAAVPDALIEVAARGPGHFEITVTAAAFDGKNRVQQHQLVYGAIADLMSGTNAPVHAIDRLECRTP
jgi:stress-induced morphogen